jgi:DNA invertase Pin-like site-specific DNA recombinase
MSESNKTKIITTKLNFDFDPAFMKFSNIIQSIPEKKRNQKSKETKTTIKTITTRRTNNDRFIVDKIITHRTKGTITEYYVKHKKNDKYVKSWILEKNLLNSKAMIDQYWQDKLDNYESRNESRNETNSKTKKTCEDGSNIKLCDPFMSVNKDDKDDKNDHIMNNDDDDSDDDNDDDDDSDDDDNNDVKYTKHKKPKIREEDIVEEIENILDDELIGKNHYYQIKWVGSKIPTWITSKDFLETDLLNEYHKYKAARADTSLTRRAYIYCRTSKRNSDTEISIYDQEKKCLEFAKKNNINIIGLYRDNGVSAKDMDNQFALNHICDMIRKGECILFYDISRFSRSMIQALQRLEDLRLNVGAFAHSVHDGITWNNVATNRAAFRNVLSHSQLHSDIVSEKVLSSVEYRRERGDHVGYIPFGYMTKTVNGINKLIKNNDEIKIIRKIFAVAANVVMTENDVTESSDQRLHTGNENKPSKTSKSSKSKKNSKHKKLSKKEKKISDNDRIDIMKKQDFQNIADEINVHYDNRGKPFTWSMIRKIMLSWKNKI